MDVVGNDECIEGRLAVATVSFGSSRRRSPPGQLALRPHGVSVLKLTRILYL